MLDLTSEPPKILRGTSAVLRDSFLKTVIADAKVYHRAAGFFSSSVFRAAAKEFTDFFCNGGRMELVCCPQLDRRDVAALTNVFEDRKRWAEYAVPDSTDSLWSARDLMCWAIAMGHLHVSIATVKLQTSHAIYHEKLGVVEGKNGSLLAFSGSANESLTAYVHNFERIQVYRDDNRHQHEMIQHLRQDFESLWSNQTPGLKVLPLHEALALNLVQPVEHSGNGVLKKASTPPAVKIRETLVWPARLKLRSHQEEAIDRWFEAQGTGIYAMATGAGKTIAALSTAVRVFERVGGPLIIVVVAPFLALVDQWIESMSLFGLKPVRCAESSSTWVPQAQNALLLANQGRRSVTSFVTTNATLMGKPFQLLLAGLEVRTLFIADEVHNLGAQRLRASLPEAVELRLGLSATHERKWDEAGTQAIKDYFGEPVISFGLREAMESNPPVLCPYSYHPILVRLQEDEMEAYTRLSRSIGRLLAGGTPDDPSEIALSLLIKRARLLAGARGKLPALKRVMEPLSKTSFNLIYCGDGRTDPTGLEPDALDDSDEGELVRQIEAVVHMLGNELGMRVASYTSQTPSNQRAAILESFRQGHLQAIVAIRCLDEGVDIPQVRRAFILASSTNPRQFIQRRGRVLRRAPDKEKAEIYDFFVFPPMEDMDSSLLKTEQKIVRRGMERALDFLALAINATEARHQFLPILKQLHLLDMLYGSINESIAQ